MPITITGMDQTLAKLQKLDKINKTLGPVLKKKQRKI